MSKCENYHYGDTCNKNGMIQTCPCKGDKNFCNEEIPQSKVEFYDVAHYIITTTSKIKLEILIDMAEERLKEIDK